MLAGNLKLLPGIAYSDPTHRSSSHDERPNWRKNNLADCLPQPWHDCAVTAKLADVGELWPTLRIFASRVSSWTDRSGCRRPSEMRSSRPYAVVPLRCVRVTFIRRRPPREAMITNDSQAATSSPPAVGLRTDPHDPRRISPHPYLLSGDPGHGKASVPGLPVPLPSDP